MAKNPVKEALVIIDMQNDFCSSDGMMAKRGIDVSAVQSIVPNVQRAVEHAKRNECLIIYIQTHHHSLSNAPVWESRSEGVRQLCSTLWGKDFYGIRPEKNDLVIEKNRYDAFLGTNLDLILRSQGINRVLFAGCTTNVCVESTVRHGFMLNYGTITLEDATAAYSQNEHENALFNLKQYFGKVRTINNYFKERELLSGNN
ncbi:cysteine hydrolase family protein [Bacillus sp. FJAT-44742]|uniref:cysteine hydrolase family protein n=1 Tax=Bacillus sp. FJAT-44742 TaxID=2014005 RepID=UPI000C24D8B4|nr:isochorismatase family cysteine hydrolase [Bacillus sp. FJAT-44742]